MMTTITRLVVITIDPSWMNNVEVMAPGPMPVHSVVDPVVDNLHYDIRKPQNQ